MPAQVRLERIYTGTWSQKLSYSVWYKTNHKKDYKLLEEKFSTQTETEIDCTKAALGLAADEYVTDVKFEFGTVEPGFCETSSPHLVVTTLAELPQEHRITNRTDVGGRTGEEWIYAKDSWTTVVYGKPKGKLPKTGI